MSSSEDEYHRRYWSPSPYFENRRSRKSSFSPDRRQRRRSHDDYKKKEVKSSRAVSPPLSFSSGTCLERTPVLKPKKEGNVIESMENAFMDGPLEVLKRCVHDGQRVMVWVRGQKSIRGICTGFVLAFDKYWNLVMQDVDEVYQKNINPRTPFLLPEKSMKKTEKSKTEPEFFLSEEAGQELREGRKKKEEEKRKRNAERPQVCKRHLPKAFLRGDNVVCIKICE